MTKLLQNKTAIITGGSRGIGKAIAEKLAQESCNLMIAARTESELEGTSKTIQDQYNVKVITSKTDISDEKSVLRMVENTINEFGQIDILINNAATIGPMGSIEDISPDDFFHALKINIGGTIFTTRAVLPLMKENDGGWIINLSGVD